jgi:CRISPR-associated endonuclease/helicase Cas3
MSACPEFSTFFEALWERECFPWQRMLAERVAEGSWPKAIDLPTASGKTACMDIALWALASQADRSLEERTAPRRIWFVVDRRIIVDEAFDRARRIAEKLADAESGPLREIADRLRRIAGTERPVAVARLRGGVFRDDGWARLPSQPAIISSTVDQLGSSLLFRGYGRSQLAAPIFAGLAANDSLVLLDEAHCSVPFLQTLRAVEEYRGERWSESPLRTPFAFVVMSATPPSDILPDEIFPGRDRDRALDHPGLRKRLHAQKLAELCEVKTKKDETDALVAGAARRAQAFLNAGKRRIAVMVNRVATAMRIADTLHQQVGEQADVVLLTGRLRPYERDELVRRWAPFLKADAPSEPPKPIIVVSTQCLEVGADFSFDALVTEAASLDSLRQRFGRLDRMGTMGRSEAVILIRDGDADPENAASDPVYGSALAHTWRFLKDTAGADRKIDLGVEALRQSLEQVDDLSSYLAPIENAPVLLPAHLDLLCQTVPAPHPEPDIAQFLHGMGRGAPEIRVVWRADLNPDDNGTWVETIAMCRPVSGEMLSVPLYRVRTWLAQHDRVDDTYDIEGVARPEDVEMEIPTDQIQPCVVWRGQHSRVARRVDDIAVGDVVVIPAAYGMEGLGRTADIGACGLEGLDLWERTVQAASRPVAVRLQRAVLAPWLGCKRLTQLVELVETPSWERDALQDAIESVLAYEPTMNEDAPAPPEWWKELLRKARYGRVEEHPAGGAVLFERAGHGEERLAEPDLFADDDDLTSLCNEPVSLDEHSALVKQTVEKLAARCVSEGIRPILATAAWWHDAGKLDERFQVLLHGGDVAAALAAKAPRAKSEFVPATPAARRALREASGLPENFRHEMLSVQLAERYAPNLDSTARDLVLHLVASHHGYARPFAPICKDPEPPSVAGKLGDASLELSAEERRNWIAHRVDSGLTDRFWRLTRRYGWWELAYLEAILRLGDWYASGLKRAQETVT